MSRWNLAWLLGISAITLVGLSLSYSSPGNFSGIKDKHENISLLIDVLDEVQKKYVKPLDKKKMRELVENMVNSGLEKLDPHSGFINEDEYKAFTKHSQGKFGGVGIRIKVDAAGQVLVESPMVGTPAYKAGVIAGDMIVKVDGKVLDAVSSKDVVDMIQGDPGTKVTLTVIHEGETKETDIEIVRDVIAIDSVLGDTPLTNAEKKWEYMIDKENKVAYIRIVGFTETTVEELTKVVQELQADGMKGLIIDLRNNPGGLLKSAVDVSSMFLEPGKKVVSTKGRTQQEQTYNSRPPHGMKPLTNTPIVILINRYSASASEIVAAALQDHLRAIIMGERSYGKGSVQNIIEMEGGASALKLTTAGYHRPSGKNIHRFPDSKKEDDWGVKPDVEIKIDTKEFIDYFKYRRDKDILHKPGSKHEENKFTDRVMEKAKEHLIKEIKKQPAKQDAAAPNPAPAQQLHEAKVLPKVVLPVARVGQLTPLLWCQEETLARPPLLAELRPPIERTTAALIRHEMAA